MVRSCWTGIVRALVACWLGALAAEPAALHICPTHDYLLAAPEAVVHGDGMPMPAGQAAPHQHHGKGHSCSCLGACCASSPAVLPTPARLTIAVTARPAVASPWLDVTFRPATPDYSRPPSVGPPFHIS